MELGLSLALVALASALYLVALAIYRLTLHPLARFPGPRLAALTFLYEGYYEVLCLGQYSAQISKLHDRHGPIVRVTPNELHIRDSQFFDSFYAKNLHLDKEGWHTKFGTEDGLLTTVDAGLHKRRRAALSPMFSRRSILDFVHIIFRHLDTLSVRMQQFEAGKEPINLTHAFPALTGDIIMDYFFGFNYAQLKHPEFDSFHEGFSKMGNIGHVATQLPCIVPIMHSLPDCVVGWMQPAARAIIRFKQDQWDNIGRIMRGEVLKTNDAKRTIFHELLESKLPDCDKSQKRLADEAQIVVGGGVETTAFCLSVASFHIINTPRIYERLHADLVAAFPNRAAIELYPLENMPYLKAIILESARLSYGLSARNPRTRRNMPLQYKDWLIPQNTNVSMSIVDVSHDESIFPDSHAFIPERWLNNPTTVDGFPLERFLVCFGRGTRSCLGINLAWTELYLTLGMMFRRYQFTLHEADVSDVALGHDFFIPATKLDSKGVRVFVESTSD